MIPLSLSQRKVYAHLLHFISIYFIPCLEKKEKRKKEQYYGQSKQGKKIQAIKVGIVR